MSQEPASSGERSGEVWTSWKFRDSLSGPAAAAEIPAQVRSEVSAQAQSGLAFVPAAAAEDALRARGVPSADASAIAGDYSEAQIRALKTALGGVAVIVLLGFGATRRLPAEPMSGPTAANSA